VATILDFRDFRRSLACHNSAVNKPIAKVFGDLVDGKGFYKAAELQTPRLKTDVASNGQTFGKVQNR